MRLEKGGVVSPGLNNVTVPTRHMDGGEAAGQGDPASPLELLLAQAVALDFESRAFLPHLHCLFHSVWPPW